MDGRQWEQVCVVWCRRLFGVCACALLLTTLGLAIVRKRSHRVVWSSIEWTLLQVLFVAMRT